MNKIIPNSFWNSNEDKINQWMQSILSEGLAYNGVCGNKPIIYSSVDVRVSEFKVAHVDANIFPAGFNNIHVDRFDSVQNMFDEYFREYAPDARKILLISEEFTRNMPYFENIKVLKKLLGNLGRECEVGFINQNLKKIDDSVYLGDWRPDVIILNSDLSQGFPDLLKNISQEVIPSPVMGWHSRSKYNHFLAFQGLIDRFAEFFGIDPWLLSTYFRISNHVNFREKIGLEDIASKVEEVISETQLKYQQYNISERPHVFIKADRGTFGAGIMTVSSAKEVIDINKKFRHSMNTISHGVLNSALLIQEAVPTSINIDGSAEHVYYMVGGKPAFRMVRQNSSKDRLSNLNSTGMKMLSDPDISYCAEYVISAIAALSVFWE